MHSTINLPSTPVYPCQYRINSRLNISIAYGLHSKLLPLGYYFFQNTGINNYPNHDLGMLRSHHYILAVDRLLKKNWRIHAELYYQHLFQIPVVNDINRTFWMLNELEGYAKEALVSKGTGTNKGVDLSLEKFFTKGFFMIASFSFYQSSFEPLNGQTYNTRFNAGNAGSWTGAKEWTLKKNLVFQAGWKAIYNAGQRLTPLTSFQNSNRAPIEDETRPFTEKVNPFFARMGDCH